MKAKRAVSLLLGMWWGVAGMAAGQLDVSEADQRLNRAMAAWEKLAFDGDGGIRDPTPEVATAFDEYRAAWYRASDRAHWGNRPYYYALAAIHTAEMLVELGEAPKAAAYLKEAAEVSDANELNLSRGKNPRKFEEVAAVHAAVLAATGTDPMAGISIDYTLTRRNGGFIAIREMMPYDEPQLLGYRKGEEPRPEEMMAGLVVLSAKGKVLGVHDVAVRKDSTLPFAERITTVYVHVPASPAGHGGGVRNDPETFFAEKWGDPSGKHSQREEPLSQDAKAEGEVRLAPWLYGGMALLFALVVLRMARKGARSCSP